MFALILLCAPFAVAQDEYNKFEVFAGYSHNRVDVGTIEDRGGDVDFNDIFDEREGYNGFEVSMTGNVSRYVGSGSITRTIKGPLNSELIIPLPGYTISLAACSSRTI